MPDANWGLLDGSWGMTEATWKLPDMGLSKNDDLEEEEDLQILIFLAYIASLVSIFRTLIMTKYLNHMLRDSSLS